MGLVMDMSIFDISGGTHHHGYGPPKVVIFHVKKGLKIDDFWTPKVMVQTIPFYDSEKV